MFKLKKGQEAFTPVEGPFAGRKFVAGQIYGEIPPGTAGRFEEINKDAPATAAGKKAVEWVESNDPRREPKKADSKKAGVYPFPPSEKGGGKS